MSPSLWQRTTALLVAGALAAAGCGGDDDESGSTAKATPTPRAGSEPAIDRQAARPLTGGITRLTVDADARRALGAVGIELEAIGGARLENGRYAFPISGGTLQAAPPRGRIEHEGGLRFSAAGQSVDATDFVIRPEDGVLTANVAGRRVPLLRLDLGVPKTSPSGEGVVIEARASNLGQDVVARINERLGIDVLEGGLDLGQLSVGAARGKLEG